MSRSKKDAPGGHSSKFYVSDNGVSDFKRQCRKSARLRARKDLAHGVEPTPDYPVAHTYWD